jgi:hypothetical protein
MDTKTIELVEMTPEQKAEFEAFKAAKEQKEKAENIKKERENYKLMVDNYIMEQFPVLKECSENIARCKKSVMDTFMTAIELKSELFKVENDQQSHTFTSIDGKFRIIVGNYSNDGYADTVNEGIAIVKEVVSSMAKDDESRALVEAILKLLSKDQKGTLKASRVIQLRQMAEQLGNDRLIEGVRIIEDSYQPTASRTFIKAAFKNDNKEWESIPLGISEA